MKKTAILIAGMLAIVLGVGCASGKAYEKELSGLRQNKGDMEQKNRNLENDMTKLYEQIDLLLNEMKRRIVTQPQIKEMLSPKQENLRLTRKLELKGLEVIQRNEKPSVVLSNLFESGSVIIATEGKNRLKETSRIIKAEVSGASFRIDGYTDSTPVQKSKHKSNEALSLERAKAAKDFLVTECGFDGRIIATEGLGAENPIADNNTAAGRIKNRRIEIVIIINQ